MPKKKANAAPPPPPPLAAATATPRGTNPKARSSAPNRSRTTRGARGERREAGLLSSSLLIETLPKMQMPAGCPPRSLSLPPLSVNRNNELEKTKACRNRKEEGRSQCQSQESLENSSAQYVLIHSHTLETSATTGYLDAYLNSRLGSRETSTQNSGSRPQPTGETHTMCPTDTDAKLDATRTRTAKMQN